MKRRTAQPLFVLSVAVTLVLTLSVVVLSAQFDPIVHDIGFEIEGNTALNEDDCIGLYGYACYDWENTEFPPAIHIPDPNSKIEADPTTFKPNSKFDDPAGWSITTGRVGPGQSELVNFLVWDIQPGDLGDGRPNDHWLVLGMERIKTPGFFELDFEYNQVAWDGSSGTLIRTPGDVLVGFELRGKPTSKRAEYKVLLLQYLPGAQPSLCSTTPGPGGEPELVEVGADPCPAYGGSGWYYRLLADDALSAESGLVQATMNTEPFAPPWDSIDGSGNPCDVIGPYQFAEAAINLTALGIEPDCSDPGTVHAKSRSAPHVHSDLKDLVGPVPLLPCAARLDGHKFEDLDGDRQWGADEPPLEGWEIKLSDGSVTHTDADGYYAFEDLDYGTYTVSEVCPQGDDWVQTAPTPDDPNSCGEAVHTVTLDSCTPEANDLDFGNRFLPPARLDGHKFLDIDGDGSWDQPDEPPLEGWEIKLSDGSVTRTDAEGYYAFEDLDYGTYTVSEVCPQDDDWVQTAPIPDDPNSCGQAVHTVTLDCDTPEVNNLDFGNRFLPPARLDGHKFLDSNEDGLWGEDEPPLEGWEIKLSDGSVTHTDAEGYYAFEDLAYGTYTVSEVCPQDVVWNQTAPVPSGPFKCDGVHTVELDSGNPEVNDLDFGNIGGTPYVLLVSKDAQTSFTRTYLWDVEKVVDNEGPILLYPGDFAEVTYTVTATQASPDYIDSDWAVEGSITIRNDGLAAVRLASLTDVITPGDIEVPFDCGGVEIEDVILESLQALTCSYGPVPLPDGSARTNTATVTVQDSTEEWTGTADIVFDLDQPTTEMDKMADVEDSQWGDLGVAEWDETPEVFTYTWKIEAPGDECGLFTVPNTATLTTNDTSTVVTDTADVEILEVCQVTIAYEDLPLSHPKYKNDWDYNDLVVHVPISLTVSPAGDLEAANLIFTQEEVKTAFDHTFNVQPFATSFTCTGTFTKEVTFNGTTTTETGDYFPGDNFEVIAHTGVFEEQDEFLVELDIDFTVEAAGDCPRYFEYPDPVNQYHGEWLFFDPWLTVYPTVSDLDTYQIHVAQDPPEPRILTVPADWTAPPEKTPIWLCYPSVQAGNPPGFTSFWWENWDPDCGQ